MEGKTAGRAEWKGDTKDGKKEGQMAGRQAEWKGDTKDGRKEG